MSLWHEYIAVLTDPAHLLTELTVAVAVELASLPWLISRRLKRRDRAHGHESIYGGNPCAEIPTGALGPGRSQCIACYAFYPTGQEHDCPTPNGLPGWGL